MATLALLQVPASAVRLMVGGQVIDGGCASTTVTSNMHIAVLPAASVAVDVTLVVPTGKVDPDGGTDTTVTVTQVSVAVTVYVTFDLEHCPGLALTVIGAGHSMAGGVVSRTNTVCEVVLLRVFVSDVVELTTAVFVNWPVLVQFDLAITLNVNVLDAAMSPMFHVSGLGPDVCGGFALTKASPAGRKSCRTTSSATVLAAGLTTVSRYCTLLPASTGLSTAVLTTKRSAGGPTGRIFSPKSLL